MKPNRKSLESVDDKYSKINSLKLIHLVRCHEVLYNSDADGYSDKNIKDGAWERVYRAMYPRYDALSNYIKEIISTNVRRRWKTLRNAIAREVKKNATVESYIRKKESPVIAELEFLIPHIKSAHCAKLADELGLRDCYTTVNEIDEQEYDDDFNDTVDLTQEQLDIKPFALKNYQKSNDIPSASCTVVPQEALYPTVQLNTEEDDVSTSLKQQQNLSAAWRHIDNVVAAAAAAAAQSQNPTVNNTKWNGEYCSVVQCKEGEFMSSTLLCTDPENEEHHEDSIMSSSHQQQRQVKLPSPAIAAVTATKRRRQSGNDFQNGNENIVNGETNALEPCEVQTKIIRLLTNLERRENRELRIEQDSDEDRMFLLSLVSDLKRVPSAKKMMLKAEIAMAIARAVPP